MKDHTFAQLVNRLAATQVDVLKQVAREIRRRAAPVDVNPDHLKHCAIKSASVMDMTWEEMGVLRNWCSYQSSDLWDDMSIQEILNVYRVSAEWLTWEGWAVEEPFEAKQAWNRAVIDPGNAMVIETADVLEPFMGKGGED